MLNTAALWPLKRKTLLMKIILIGAAEHLQFNNQVDKYITYLDQNDLVIMVSNCKVETAVFMFHRSLQKMPPAQKILIK